MDIQRAKELIHACWGTSIDKKDYIVTALQLDGGCQLFGDGEGKGSADINHDNMITAEELCRASNNRPEIETKFDEMTKARISSLSFYRRDYINNDPFPWKNIEMIQQFGIINDNDTVDILFNILTTDTHPMVREEAAKMLGMKFGDCAVYASHKLLEALSLTDSYYYSGIKASAMPFYRREIKASIIMALGELRCGEASSYIISYINEAPKDTNGLNETMAIISLCKIGNPRYLDNFRSILQKNKKILGYDCLEGDDPFRYIKHGIDVSPLDKDYLRIASKILRHER